MKGMKKVEVRPGEGGMDAEDFAEEITSAISRALVREEVRHEVDHRALQLFTLTPHWL